MPAAPIVRVTGLRETIKALKTVDANLPKALRTAGLEAAAPVAATAQSRAPVLSGALQSTVRAGATQRGAVVRAGGAKAPYAGPIHFGWPARNIKAQPFLYNAADARRSAVVKVYERRVSELIRSAGF